MSENHFPNILPKQTELEEHIEKLKEQEQQQTEGEECDGYI